MKISLLPVNPTVGTIALVDPSGPSELFVACRLLQWIGRSSSWRQAPHSIRKSDAKSAILSEDSINSMVSDWF